MFCEVNAGHKIFLIESEIKNKLWREGFEQSLEELLYSLHFSDGDTIGIWVKDGIINTSYTPKNKNNVTLQFKSKFMPRKKNPKKYLFISKELKLQEIRRHGEFDWANHTKEEINLNLKG